MGIEGCSNVSEQRQAGPIRIFWILVAHDPEGRECAFHLHITQGGSDLAKNVRI